MDKTQRDKEVELAFFQFYLANPARYEQGVFENCVYSRDRNLAFINEVRSEIVFPPSLVGQTIAPLAYDVQRTNAIAQRRNYPSLTEGAGWVYIYSLGNEKQCKIGCTCNPSRRFDEFFRETGSPRRYAHFVALFKVPAHSEQNYERLAHHHLAAFREKGNDSEWFNVTPVQAFAAIKAVAPNAEVIDYCGLSQEYLQRKAQTDFDEKYKKVVADYLALKQSIIDRPKVAAEAAARRAAEIAARLAAENAAAKSAAEKKIFDADVVAARDFRTPAIWFSSLLGAAIFLESFQWPAKSSELGLYCIFTLIIAALLFTFTDSPEERAKKKAEKRNSSMTQRP